MTPTLLTLVLALVFVTALISESLIFFFVHKATVQRLWNLINEIQTSAISQQNSLLTKLGAPVAQFVPAVSKPIPPADPSKYFDPASGIVFTEQDFS